MSHVPAYEITNGKLKQARGFRRFSFTYLHDLGIENDNIDMLSQTVSSSVTYCEKVSQTVTRLFRPTEVDFVPVIEILDFFPTSSCRGEFHDSIALKKHDIRRRTDFSTSLETPAVSLTCHKSCTHPTPLSILYDKHAESYTAENVAQ